MESLITVHYSETGYSVVVACCRDVWARHCVENYQHVPEVFKPGFGTVHWSLNAQFSNKGMAETKSTYSYIYIYNRRICTVQNSAIFHRAYLQYRLHRSHQRHIYSPCFCSSLSSEKGVQMIYCSEVSDKFCARNGH